MVYTGGMNRATLERAVQSVPGKTKRALAEACGVKPQAVSQWFACGKAPPGRCLAIEQATGGEVTRYELRPDVFGESESAAA